MAKAKRKPAAKRPAKAARTPARRPTVAKHEEDHIDGCGCGFEFRPGDATADADLPPARGGVEGAAGRRQ